MKEVHKHSYSAACLSTCTATYLDETAVSGTKSVAIPTQICPTEQQMLPGEDYRAVIVR
jgi:hypothetical protein